MLDDVKKYVEAAVENLSPTKAQKLAKQLLEPDARKEQVSKVAGELLDWSHRNRERLREFVSREVTQQMKGVGVATQSEVDNLKRRVRELERAAGMTASRRKAGSKPQAKKPASASKRSASKKSSTAATG